ncbi:MAG: histidine kinase dimerization/phospho-acceptor domain-containing protein, partial [Giesbergeria sp.]|nr:histidine kinase dimerization/phospho-acceptor domain-containing protein [Giesbergeria sp.]
MAVPDILHRVRAAWRRAPLHWERDEILAMQVLLLRRSFPMTLAASALTSLGTVWLLSLVVPVPIMLSWLAVHMLVITGVYLGLRPLPRAQRTPRQDAERLTQCMAAMGALWGSLGLIVWQFSNSIDGVIYCIGILSTVSSGALGLGAPLYRAYVVYLTCAVGGAMLTIMHIPAPAILPAMVLVATYYSLTCLHARNLSKVARDSIAIKFENDRLVNQLRAESQRAMAAQEAAEQADRDKSRFLAAASHDLRQPLHAMGLFLESLQRSNLDEHQRTVLVHAHAASGAASEMLTTLLDYSRLEAGVVKVRPEAFAVQPLLTALEQEFGTQADTAGLVYRTRETSAA